MAVSTAFATRMKQGLLEGTENFKLSGGDTYKLALYADAATYGASTTAYSATNEVGASGTYSAGGGTLTRVDPTTSGTTAYTDFADISFTSATISSSGAMIYNSTDAGNPTCSTHYFGSIITSTAGTFNVVFPTADASNAVIRIA